MQKYNLDDEAPSLIPRIQAEAQAEETLKQARLDTASAGISALGDMMEAMGASAEAMKAIRSAEVIIETYKSATAAYAGMVSSIPGPVGIALGAVAAAASVAAGLANLAKINATEIPKFAEGTEYVGLGGNPVGTDTVPAMLNEGERVVPSDINRMLMGIPNESLPGMMQMAALGSMRMQQIAQAQLSQQQYTNRLLRGLQWQDHDGSYVDLEGNRRKYVN
jgi:hypothetical protein